LPNRILREGILTSPRVAKLGWPEEVFYRRLMSVVDDFGRYYADPGMLRAACYPRQLSKVTDPDIGKWTRNLAEAGLVRVYPAQDGESYIELLDFRQQARAKASKFPEQSSTCVADATQTTSTSVAPAPVFGDVSVDGGGDERARAAPTPGAVRPEVWERWRKYKGKQKPDSIALQAKRLDEWAAAGLDVNAIIETSIANGWAGLFPPDGRASASVTDRAKVAGDIWKGDDHARRDERVIDGEAKRVA
jgi:hypothetical protein